MQVTSTTDDLSIFDPGSIIAEKFYVSLFNLTKTLESKTPLIWSVLDVLQHASYNLAARTALTHTYKFAPLLSRFLETNLTSEKRVKLLKLLQDLTYGVKIHWQEAHLPNLVSILIQWIMQSQEDEIVTASLGILINLCYKNLPAIYTFLRTVNTKALHKLLVKRQASSINIRVQYCKLLIILEQTKNEIPEKIILEFVMMTFQNLSLALSQKDILSLKHVVEFFEDVRQNEHSKSALTIYSNYPQNIEKILQQLDGTEDPECVALIMEFLLSSVKLKNPALTPMYLQYVQIAMTWVPVDRVASKALALLKTILIDSRRSKIFDNLIGALDLSVLMLVMINDDENYAADGINGNGKRDIKINSKIAELMQLLQEMSKVSELQAQITEVFSEYKMRILLNPILEQDDIITENNWPENFFQDPSMALYIHALALTSDLAIQNSNWQALYSELMRKKQVQMMIALVLFTGEGEVKQKSLQLLASVGTPQECVPAIAKCMCEIEPLLVIQSKNGIAISVPVNNQINYQQQMSLLPWSQTDRVNAVLDELEDLSRENKINNVMTSTVMEFYEFKIAAMRQAEQANQASIEAADNLVTSLQHRLTQIIAESTRLREMLFYTQQKHDDLQIEKARLNTKLQNVEGETKKIHSSQIKEIQGLKKIVNDKSLTIEQLSKRNKEIEAESTRKIRELEEEKLAAGENIKELTKENNELKRTLDKMENSVIRKRQILETKDKELVAAQEGISALKQENEQLMKQCKSYAQIISEKEETNQKLSGELNEFRGMRDMIYQLTAKTRDHKNETT